MSRSTLLLSFTCLAILFSMFGTPYLQAGNIVFDEIIENPEPNLNLALNSTATQSSFITTERDPKVGAKLCDGFFSRYGYWMPDPEAEGSYWARIDLGEKITFRAVRIYFMPGLRDNPDTCPPFVLKAGNDPEDLEVIYTVDAENAPLVTNPDIYAGRTIELGKTKARYLEIEILEKPESFVLHEIEVFDKVPEPRTLRHEPGDRRIRFRESQNPEILRREGDLSVWTASAAERIFRDDVLGENATESAEEDPVVMTAARGEAESFQIVLHHPDGAEASVRPVMMKDEDTLALPVEWVSVNAIGFVYVRTATENLRLDIQGRKHPGEMFGPGFYPEVLLDASSRTLLPGKHQPFWVNIKVPRDAAPGMYLGGIQVETDAGTITLPIALTVRTVTLPPVEERNIVNVMTFSHWTDRQAAAALDAKTHRQQWENKRKAAAGLGRVAFSSLTAAPVTRDENDNLIYDWTAFDAEVEWYLANTPVRDFMLPWDYQSYHGWINPNTEVIGPDVEPGSDRWLALVEQALVKHSDHLDEKGWKEMFWFFAYDEPNNNLEDLMIRLVRMAQRVAPELQRITHSHPWTDAYIPLKEVYVVNPRRFHVPFHARMQKEGWKLWTYCNGASVIDGPPNSARIIPYGYYKYNITGMTWHSMDDWTDEGPWQAPYRYATWACSSCFLFPDPTDPSKALRTVRFEMWRDGQEDYELLKILEGLSADAPTESNQYEIQAVLAEARDLVTQYGFDDYMTDEELFKNLMRPWLEVPANAMKVNPNILYKDDPTLVVNLHARVCELIERVTKAKESEER